MKLRIFVINIMLVATFSDGSEITAQPKDDKKIQGVWTIESIQTGDESLTWLKQAARGATVTITAKEIQGEGGRERGLPPNVYTLDPRKKPAEINIIEHKKQTHGIYKLEDDTLTICLNNHPDKNRPTEFKAKPDPDGQFVFVLKRKKR